MALIQTIEGTCDECYSQQEEEFFISKTNMIKLLRGKGWKVVNVEKRHELICPSCQEEI